MWKAGVAGLIWQHTRKVCCIRDGANDVSIIQAADVGVSNLPQTSWNTDFTLTYFTGIGYRFTGNCNEQKGRKTSCRHMKAKQEDLQYMGPLVHDKPSCMTTVGIQDKVTATMDFISKIKSSTHKARPKSIHKKQKRTVQ